METAIIASEKPTGQQPSAMLSGFNIQSHEFYRKIDKNSIKTFKKWNFSYFLYWGHSGILGVNWNKSGYLHKKKSHEAKIIWVEFYG